MDDLTKKICVACEGGEPTLTPEEVQKYLPQVPGWEVLEDKKLRREFTFKDFKEAMAFVNKVADLAEQEGHHPDILIYGWNHMRIETSTHAIGGLSENDFILAAKINQLLS